MITLSRSNRLMMLFGATSFVAIATGALVCAANGVPAASWTRNVLAWAVGAALAMGVARFARPGLSTLTLWVAPMGLLATLISPDQEGVHRWIDLGPLHINMAMLLLPGAVVALAASAEKRAPWIAFLLALAVLVVQPDASQASTWAIVGALIAVFGTRQLAIRWGVLAIAASLVAVAWLRPDPMQPVAEVEGIVGLAFSTSPLLAGLAVLSLTAVAAVPGQATKRMAGAALGLCFMSWAVMPLFGAFPVPWVGIGMSPIVGGWLGVGLLAAVVRWNGVAEPAKPAA